jgi:hypothetical protein
MSHVGLAVSFVAKMQIFASKTNTETDSLVFKVHSNLANKKFLNEDFLDISTARSQKKGEKLQNEEQFFIFWVKFCNLTKIIRK